MISFLFNLLFFSLAIAGFFWWEAAQALCSLFLLGAFLGSLFDSNRKNARRK